MMYSQRAKADGVTSLIPIGIGSSFVSIESIESMSILHFPHVASNVEFTEKSDVITSLTKKIGKENFVWW